MPRKMKITNNENASAGKLARSLARAAVRRPLDHPAASPARHFIPALVLSRTVHLCHPPPPIRVRTPITPDNSRPLR